eukprot:m.359645 g.359645  ORF g.359645 m.359645 type:complete len:251 (-) comp18663_c0_seq1:111-863(-)
MTKSKNTAAKAKNATPSPAVAAAANVQCGTSCGTLKCLKKLVFIAIALGIFCAAIEYTRTTVFDPKELQTLAQEAIRENEAAGGSTDDLVDSVVAKMRAKYPGHILPEPEWMFNNAGGAMGAMLVLHCSFSEYIIIFGTPLGTEGHTGRFLADDYFTILEGEQWAFPAGSLQREVYKAGDQHHLPLGVAKQYKMDKTCWALEYAVGNIPAMLPFGFADSFFSTLDFVSLYQTVKVSAVGMLSELFINGKV